MVIFRKGKKILMEAQSAGAVADSQLFTEELTKAGATPAQIERVKLNVWNNLFTFAIYGAKMRIGNGYFIESETREECEKRAKNGNA